MTAGGAAQIPECVCLLPPPTHFNVKKVKKKTQSQVVSRDECDSRKRVEPQPFFFSFFIMMSAVAGVSSRISSRQKKNKQRQAKIKVSFEMLSSNSSAEGTDSLLPTPAGRKKDKERRRERQREKLHGFVFLPVSDEEEEEEERRNNAGEENRRRGG